MSSGTAKAGNYSQNWWSQIGKARIDQSKAAVVTVRASALRDLPEAEAAGLEEGQVLDLEGHPVPRRAARAAVLGTPASDVWAVEMSRFSDFIQNFCFSPQIIRETRWKALEIKFPPVELIKS